MTVLDVDGNPLPGVSVKAGYTKQKGKHIIYREATDEDGVFSFFGSIKTEIAYTVTAPGYYLSQIRVDPTGMDSRGYAVPKDTESKIRIKDIRRPVPLHAKFLFSVNVPKLDEPLGFDIEVMDWVSPHGRGSKADLYFEVSGYFNKPEDRQAKLVLSFPKEGDGVVLFPIDHRMGSELKSDHLAPETGYQESKTWHRNYVITRPMHTPDESPGNVVNEFSKDSGLFLRLRTELDENGEVARANYAKLYGDPTFSWDIGTGEGAIYFRHVFFNPEVNDRNLEFDQTSNLIPGLERKHNPRFP